MMGGEGWRFAHLEKHPLTDKQLQACLSDAQTSLVLAGAGTGKTSTLLGRIVYLCETAQAELGAVLPLAFAVEAAHEIQQRVVHVAHQLDWVAEDFKARTFHSLGLSIVTQVEGQAPKLSELSDADRLRAFLKEVFLQQSSGNPRYRQVLYRYFTDAEEGEGYPKRSLKDDYVANYGELQCANFLYLMGILYVYKAHYEHDIYLDENTDVPYRCSFYLPQSQTYVEVWDAQTSETHRQRCQAIHQQYGTRCLFYEEDFLLDSSQFLFPLDIPVSYSEGRVSELVEALQDLLLAFKSQGVGSDELVQWINDENQYSVRQRGLLELLLPLYQAYEQYLLQKGEIDFDGMISKAIRYIQQGDFIVPWTDILVDEFQDISLSRLQLIQVMRQQKPSIRLFCVGDDWQTIYQFAGSRLAYIRDIEDYFGEVNVIVLDKTFRFHQGLCRLSSQFIQKNPRQYQKQLDALRAEQEGVVLVAHDPAVIPIRRVVEDFYRSFCGQGDHNVAHKSCLVLARFHHQLPTETVVTQWRNDYPWLDFRVMTIHASKGIEADFVIVLGVESGEYGLPSEKPEGMAWFDKEMEDYPHASERRVFYVALTRAKECVYLCYTQDNPSSFIAELQKIIPLREQRDGYLVSMQAVRQRLVQGCRRLIFHREVQEK